MAKRGLIIPERKFHLGNPGLGLKNGRMNFLMSVFSPNSAKDLVISFPNVPINDFRFKQFC
jgi:hypothetical protein